MKHCKKTLDEEYKDVRADKLKYLKEGNEEEYKKASLILIEAKNRLLKEMLEAAFESMGLNPQHGGICMKVKVFGRPDGQLILMKQVGNLSQFVGKEVPYTKEQTIELFVYQAKLQQEMGREIRKMPREQVSEEMAKLF